MTDVLFHGTQLSTVFFDGAMHTILGFALGWASSLAWRLWRGRDALLILTVRSVSPGSIWLRIRVNEDDVSSTLEAIPPVIQELLSLQERLIEKVSEDESLETQEEEDTGPDDEVQ